MPNPSRREVTQPVFEVKEPIPGEFRPVQVVSQTGTETHIVDGGLVPTHDLYRFSFTDATTEAKVSERWVLLPFPEAVVDVHSLLDTVTAQPITPTRTCWMPTWTTTSRVLIHAVCPSGVQLPQSQGPRFRYYP